MRALSGLQKRVIASYRACLRQGKRLPSSAARLSAVQYARSQFRTNASLGRMDVQRIEFLLRQCNKKLEFMANSEVTSFDFAPGRDPTQTELLLSRNSGPAEVKA
jgi:succinate dehydrogenase assembly factor 1